MSVFYDPMIAKLVVHGPDRLSALSALVAALDEYHIVGMHTNVDFLKKLATHAAFMQGQVETGFIEKHRQELFAEPELDSKQLAIQSTQLALCLMLQSRPRPDGQHEALAFGYRSGLAPFVSKYVLTVGSRQLDVTLSRSDSLPAVEGESPSLCSTVFDPVAKKTIGQLQCRSVSLRQDAKPMLTGAPSPSSTVIVSQLDQARVETTVVSHPENMERPESLFTLFTKGAQPGLAVSWRSDTKQYDGPVQSHIAALGSSADAQGAATGATSLKSPMPCKIASVR